MNDTCRHRLVIVEGLPCSGKSTVSAGIAEYLGGNNRVCFVDEGTGQHPADYEFHALAPIEANSSERRIVSLASVSDEQFERLLSFKIYDGLPWMTERPLMLEKWKQFVREADPQTVYVFNCVLLQNPMCETMMRFGFEEKDSQEYIGEIVQIIRKLNPLVVYLKNDDLEDTIQKASVQRPGWLDGVIAYHENGIYGKRICAKGFDGYIRCLAERQRRELRILSNLPLDWIVLENPQRNWQAAKKKLMLFLKKTQQESIGYREIIEAYFAAWLKKDEMILPYIFANDAVYSECYGPEYHGLHQIRCWFADWNRRGTVLRWEISRMIAHGNTVCAEWYFSCEYEGVVDGFNGVSVIEFNDRKKMISVREYQSKAEHTFPYKKE